MPTLITCTVTPTSDRNMPDEDWNTALSSQKRSLVTDNEGSRKKRPCSVSAKKTDRSETDGDVEEQTDEAEKEMITPEKQDNGDEASTTTSDSETNESNDTSSSESESESECSGDDDDEAHSGEECDGLDSFNTVDILTKVVKTLSSDRSSDTQLSNLFELLRKSIHDAPDFECVQNDLAYLGCYPATLRAMDMHTKNTSLVRHAAQILWVCAIQDPMAAQATIRLGGIPVIGKATRFHRDDHEIQLVCYGLLKELVLDKASAEQMLNVLPTALAALRQHTDNEKFVRRIASLMIKTLKQTSEAKTVILENDGLKIAFDTVSMQETDSPAYDLVRDFIKGLL